MKAKLNSTTIKKFEPESKAYEVVDTDIKGFLLRVQPTGRKTFYFSYRTPAGKRKRIKIGVLGSTKTAGQARDDALEFAGKTAKGVDIQGEKLADRKHAKDLLQNTLELFLENQYKPWVLINRKSGQHTVDNIYRSFPDFLSNPMSEITIRQIEQWRTSTLKGGSKPSSINRTINSLRAVLSKALEWGIIDEHPLNKLKALKVDTGNKARFLSEEESQRLYHALCCRDQELKNTRNNGNQFRSERNYPLLPDLSKYDYGDRMTPLVTLSLKTGMRRGELFDLLWSDIDLTNKVVTVRGETAKSSKTRHIPLSPIALDTITNWKQQSPLIAGRVFPSDNGERLVGVKKSWASILKNAGIQQFRWHDMRHDFASQMVMKGVPLNTVRELCGHADLNTTLRYAHLAPDHKADAIALIG